MKLIARTYLVSALVVITATAYFLWHLHSTRMEKRAIADAARIAQQGADLGDANAEYDLGEMLLRGNGVSQDYVAAQFWFRKAAAQDLAKAELAVGDFYFDGVSVTRSCPDALSWYRKAASSNYPMADQAMGKLNYFGCGVPQSYLTAFRWYMKSAVQGTPMSEYDVGHLYLNGLGVVKDDEEAVRWYRMSAAQGFEEAQRALGLRLSPLQRSAIVAQLVVLAAGLFLALGYVSPTSPRSDRNERLLALAGLLGCLESGMYLLGHSQSAVFPSAELAMGCRGLTSLLGGIAIGIFAITVWPRFEKAFLAVSILLIVAAGILVVARGGMASYSEIAWHIAVHIAGPLGMATPPAIAVQRRARPPQSLRETERIEIRQPV